MPGALGTGFTGGMIENQLDLQAVQQGQQKIQLGQWALAEAPIKMQEEQIQLQKDKMQLAQQTRMLSLMQNLKPPQDANSPEGMADVFDQISMMELQSGNPDAAMKSANAASKLRDTSSKVDARSYRMQNDRLSKFANILDSVPDSPQGYAQAIQAMVASDPGVAQDKRFVQLAQQPWQPGMMDSIKRGVLTAKEQAEVNYRQKAAEHAEAATKDDEARLGLIKAQTQRTIDQDIKIKKEGGSTPTVKASQLKAITDMADTDYPGSDPADIRMRSRPVAEEAVRMLRENPGLTESEAMRRAYERARGAQVYSGLRTAPTAPGAKPGKGLPMPKPTAGMTKEQYISKFRENQWYDVNGVPMLASGGKLWSEAELKGRGGPTETDDDDDDEDSED